MPRKSFSLTAERVDPEPGYDGLAAVFNSAPSGSNKVIAITDIQLYHPSGFNSDVANLAGNQGIIALERISAFSGGTLATAMKFDTNSSALPAGIKLATFPLSVTPTGNIRRFGDAFSFSILQSISWYAGLRAPGPVDTNDHSGRTAEGQDVWHADGISDTEPIVLREGEGVAAIKRAYGLPQAHHWSITIRVSGTGKSYKYTLRDTGSPYCLGDAIWSLFNESGSGVVIQVYVISMPDLGESNIPRYRICRIAGIVEGGTAIQIAKHDTNDQIQYVSGFMGPFRADFADGGLVINYLNYQGSPVTIAQQQQIGIIRHLLHSNPIYTESGTPPFRFYNETEVWPGERRQGGLENDALYLNPGEGLAILGGGAGLIECSEGAYVNVEFRGYQFEGRLSQPSYHAGVI
jgi:hypothetical protein